MSTKLFGNHIPPACKYCEKALRLIISKNQVLCGKYGVVSADYSCRHYVYNPLLRQPILPESSPKEEEKN